MKWISAESSSYEGGWRDGMRHGKGILIFSPSESEKGYQPTRYVGDWVNDKQIGHGIMTWHKGTDRYEGDYQADGRTGYGVKVWANGDHYEGEWLQGDMSGKGIYTTADGTRLEASWLNDEATGIAVKKDGTRHNASYKSGKLSVDDQAVISN